MTTQRARIDFPSRIGVWWVSDTWAMPDAQAVARDIEAMGYGSLFLPETVGKECLTESAAFLAATEKLVVGTGIANIHVRIPSAAETGARTLTALYPGRFVLGLGVSHAPLVEYGMGGTYQKPLATMRGYLEKMAAVPDAIEPGTRAPEVTGGVGAQDDRAVRQPRRRRPPVPGAAVGHRDDPGDPGTGQVDRLRAGRGGRR